MGRYDKLKVYDGSSFITPNQIKVWNGSAWIDYGTNLSSNTNVLGVYNNGWLPVTKHKATTETDKHLYVDGTGTSGISMGNQFQFYTNGSGDTAKYSFEFTMDEVPASNNGYMLYEYYDNSPATYIRFGVYTRNGKTYAYATGQRTDGDGVSTGSIEMDGSSYTGLQAGVRYAMTIENTNGASNSTLTVYNHSTQTTESKSGYVPRFYGYVGTSAMLGKASGDTGLAARIFKGKVYNIWLQGAQARTNNYYVQYVLEDSTVGSPTLVARAHTGTIGDITHGREIRATQTTTWVDDTL